jgi:RND family efflux transporter MFP subunit
VLNIQSENAGAVSQASIDRGKGARDRSAALLDQAKESLNIAREGARLEDIRAQEAEIKSLEARVVKAKNELEYTELVAPFDGTISAKYIENYQTVAAGKTVCRLLDTSRIEIVIDVPESKISLIDYVEDIVCLFDAFPDVEFKDVAVKEIGTEASATTRTYSVTLIMDQPAAAEGVKILPGMAGRVCGSARLPEDAEAIGFIIPETALFEGEDGRKYVWLIDSTTHQVRRSEPITSWESTSLGIRVHQLEPGQWIAVSGVHYIHDGQEVKILGDVETNPTATDPPPTATSAEPIVTSTESKRAAEVKE